jgi:hypothetical protein
MASERQIAANRRNASKSKGPRSLAGKTRASQNARRHGFGSKSWRALANEAIDRYAREICGDLIDLNEVSLEHARSAAEAMIQLDQVRAAKLSMIERAIAFGCLPTTRDFKAELAQIKSAIKIIKSLEKGGGQELLQPFPEEILFSTMPNEKRERSFEAIRRILPELARLERYEKRAACRRDRAIRLRFKHAAIAKK